MSPIGILGITLVVALGVIIVPIVIGVSLRRRFDRSADTIGSAVSGVSSTLDQLLEQQERTARRLENLETIVTSVDWDRVSVEPEPLSPEISEEPSPEEKAHRIARRVR